MDYGIWYWLKKTQTICFRYYCPRCKASFNTKGNIRFVSTFKGMFSRERLLQHAFSELHFNCPERCRKCQGPSHLCSTAALLSEISRIQCSKCRIYFPSELCYSNHLKKGIIYYKRPIRTFVRIGLGERNGKSQCDYSIYCSDCDKTYFTMHGGEHSCGQHNCKRCRKLQPTDHVCFMARVKKIEKRISRTRIYYDFEVC